MGLYINHNLMALTAFNNLTSTYGLLNRSINRLSSGLRINSSADDAAGLAVRELMRADIAVLNQGVRNANDAISLLQTMDGAAQVIDEKLIRMKELAEQAATGTYNDDQRSIMNDEFDAMRDEIERIAQATEFNGIKMLNMDDAGTKEILNVTENANNFATGSVQVAFTSFTSGTNMIIHWTAKDGTEGYADFQVRDSKTVAMLATSINGIAGFDGTAAWSSGTGLTVTGDTSGVSSLDLEFILNAGTTYQFSPTTEGADGQVKIHFGTGNDSAEDYYYVNKQNMTATGLSINALSIATQANAQAALTTINTAINTKDTARAHFGAMMNRLSNTVSNLTIQAENIQAAESQVSDVDVAWEMTQFVNNQIKAQAAVAMLAQSNTVPQLALTLLGGR
jgi:flagellin